MGLIFVHGRALSAIGKNDVGRLLGDHVDRRGKEVSGNSREDRSIDDAQAFDTVHPETAVEHAAIFSRTDGAGAAGMDQ